MDWRCGSRSRASALQAPALQAQSPEFKPQSSKKKKKKKTVGFTVLFLQKNHYSRIILNFS
jgi:hypothetical protein